MGEIKYSAGTNTFVNKADYTGLHGDQLTKSQNIYVTEYEPDEEAKHVPYVRQFFTECY